MHAGSDCAQGLASSVHDLFQVRTGSESQSRAATAPQAIRCLNSLEAQAEVASASVHLSPEPGTQLEIAFTGKVLRLRLTGMTTHDR